MMKNKLAVFLIAAAFLIALPLFAQQFGQGWVRIMALALLYVLLALGLNIVVGYAGLLDLGFVAFYAIGAYMYALLASPHLSENFEAFKAAFPAGLHTPIWMVIPLGAALAGIAGALLGAPTLKLRGDYLAIVTLGFGEIIRVFLNNLEQPLNITNGPRGLDRIDSMTFFGLLDFGKGITIGGFAIPSVSLYYYLFLVLVVASVVICHRQHEAAGVRDGCHFRRRVGLDVRVVPGLRVSRIVQPDGERDDRGDGRARWHRPHPGRDPRRRDAGRAARGAALRRR
jgi:branched-chain amino acid transport system permease protein